MAAMHAANPDVGAREVMANAVDFVLKTRSLFAGEPWIGHLHGGDWRLRVQRQPDGSVSVESIRPGA